MGSPDETALEAVLQAAWDPQTAAVYADLLIARGDPRGELIAIDLALEVELRPELYARKHELITSWLGGDRIANVMWDPRSVRHGLVGGFLVATTTEHSIDAYLDHLEAAAGNAVRDLSLYGSLEDLHRALDRIAHFAGGLPWLDTLVLHRSDGKGAIDKRAWDAVVAATPHLKTLWLTGDQIAVSPNHPALRTVRLQGLALAIGAEPMRGVTRVDLQFMEHPSFGRKPSIEKLAASVNPRAFPDLRVLDLSRNAPPKYEVPARAMYLAVLDKVEAIDRFERIVVPWFTSTGAEQAALVELLDRHPTLVIEVAQIYEPIDVAHPRLILPTPRAWPAQPHGRDALTVAVPGGGLHEDELALSSLVDDLEVQFDDMHPTTRAAWIAFWTFLDTLEWETDDGKTVYRKFSAATLLTALTGLRGNGRADGVRKNIEAAKLPRDAMVTLSRYWGW